MCHGAPDTSPAPSRTPPAARFQYRDCARWPPQARSTADPLEVKLDDELRGAVARRSNRHGVGPLMDPIVPPQIVSRRETPEYSSAPRTVRPSVENPSDGKAPELLPGSDGHIDETPPPPAPHIDGDTQPL